MNDWAVTDQKSILTTQKIVSLIDSFRNLMCMKSLQLDLVLNRSLEY
jgi:hypothetical protein